MKGIILYQSKYGATKKYADWISEATGFECVETKKANIKWNICNGYSRSFFFEKEYRCIIR